MPTIPDRLARLGKELLGHGDAALVWGRPDEPFVIKVGYDGADGWPAWAAWCMARPGPHVPVVHACHVFDHGGCRQGFVGVIERLWTTTVPAAWLAADRTLKRDPLRLAGLIADAHPGVADLLHTAAAAFPGALFDMAPANWMTRRCGTLVLTDPLERAG
jgi:hypothetical protein